MRGDPELREYLATRVRHILIDEGQDIVGSRAELTLALIQAVAEDCGITVFADEAQAIYGFSEEDESHRAVGPGFVDQLRTAGFEQVPLETVHRTAKPGLRTICREVRLKVLRRSGPSVARRSQIEAEVRANADAAAGLLTQARLDQIPPDGLVLARRRVDVLLYSSMCADTPHRLRMSGLPQCLKPWIAHLLWDWTQTRLTRTQFEVRWHERNAGALPGSSDAGEAWRLMVEVAGQSEAWVSLRRFREVLGCVAPPMLFCTPEFGFQGPVLGTIHASKGREADSVALYLPHIRATDTDTDAKLEEEIRVLFVGATRARKHLRVGNATAIVASSIRGRVWRYIDPPGATMQRIQIEVGRPGDLTPEGLVGRRSFATSEGAEVAQGLLRESRLRRDLLARADRNFNGDWVVETSDGRRLGLLGSPLKSDLRDISQKSARRPPAVIPGLRSLGARTLALGPDDPRLELLHEPWRSSGFLSAPLLVGFSTCPLGDKV